MLLPLKKGFNEYKELLERAGDKNQKIADHIKIIQEYYDVNIIQVENCNAPIKGQLRLMEIEEENLIGMNFIKTEIKEEVFDYNSGTVWGLMIIIFDSKKLGKKRLEEAFFQKWSHEKIVYQRFFYEKAIDEVQ